jgi:hypothetical protein
MPFFAICLVVGKTVRLPKTVRITNATLVTNIEGDRGARVCASGERVLCQLSGRMPNARMGHSGPLKLSLHAPEGTKVHLCGFDSRKTVDRMEAEVINSMVGRMNSQLLPHRASKVCHDASVSLNAVATIADALLLARRAILSSVNRQGWVEPLLAIVAAVAKHQLEDHLGASDFVRAVREAILVGKHSVAALRTLLRVDAFYFRLLDLSVSTNSVVTPGDRLVTLDVHAEVAAPPSGRPTTGAALLQSPALFFLSSHPPGWEEEQRARWAALHHSSSSSPPGQPSRHSWAQRVLDDHRDLIVSLSGGTSGGQNQLLMLWYARQLEAIALLWASGISSPRAFDKAIPPLGAATRDENPPAPPLVLEWRRVSREHPCELFAYGVPSPLALEVIAKQAPLVEMGGGTGYWAAVLRARGVSVSSFDACPTSAGTNVFHGSYASFAPVLEGSAVELSKAIWQGHALMLCYPPPRDPMAFECVRCFSGSVLVHIGEWLGDTGNLQFERELACRWELISRVPLPTWGDTTDDLTVWRRRAPGCLADPNTHSLLTCDACGAPARLGVGPGSAASVSSVLLRRCRYCRLVSYCSAECAATHAREHTRIHDLKMIRMQRPLEFHGRDFFDLRKPYIE